jgi:hypothetical protein
MFAFLKSTQEDEFVFDTHHRILLEKMWYSRRGHSELLNQFIVFQGTAEKFKKSV